MNPGAGQHRVNRSADLMIDGVLVWETPFGDLAVTPTAHGCYYRFQGHRAAATDLEDLRSVLTAALAVKSMPVPIGSSDT